MEVIYYLPRIRLELFQSVDDVLGVGGINTLDPWVAGRNVYKEKRVTESPHTHAVPENDVHVYFIRKLLMCWIGILVCFIPGYCGEDKKCQEEFTGFK